MFGVPSFSDSNQFWFGRSGYVLRIQRLAKSGTWAWPMMVPNSSFSYSQHDRLWMSHFNASCLMSDLLDIFLVCGAETFSTSAENLLQKMSIDVSKNALVMKKSKEFKEPGVSDLAVRGDGKIVATAGWDKKIRVFSTKTCRPLAVLQVMPLMWQALRICSFYEPAFILQLSSIRLYFAQHQHYLVCYILMIQVPKTFQNREVY